MIRINLLPHREEKRKARRQRFYVLTGATVLAGLAIAFAVHALIEGRIAAQDAENDFLKQEIAGLDKQIEEIKRLREQTEALLARKQVIESLQTNRADAVNLFNVLAREVPEGIYLKSVKQAGGRISLVGYAQSSARVSALMRNLEATEFLEKPELVEIQATSVANRRLNQFGLNVQIQREPTAQPAGAAPAGRPAGAAEKKS
ncbi:MAG: PilN domain-containing protein [Betaproteobacteria bacterium]|nr:PilN domain-containing protein [Betaproteobacteria bacterium]